MEKNVILAGVGGQGILSIAYVIDNAALEGGLVFKQAEVHGMAQRGGAVQSNLRIADHPIHSDLIPRGRAHLVLSVEPLEALRYREYLAPDGWVVTSTTPFVNIPDYPELDPLIARLASLPRVVLVDAKRLARAAGSARAENMVMVGAGSVLLGLPEEHLLRHVRSLFERKGEQVMDVNARAFQLGRSAGRFFLGLIDAGLGALEAYRLSEGLDPGRLADEDPRRFAAEALAAV